MKTYNINDPNISGSLPFKNIIMNGGDFCRIGLKNGVPFMPMKNGYQIAMARYTLIVKPISQWRANGQMVAIHAINSAGGITNLIKYFAITGAQETEKIAFNIYSNRRKDDITNMFAIIFSSDYTGGFNQTFYIGEKATSQKFIYEKEVILGGENPYGENSWNSQVSAQAASGVQIENNSNNVYPMNSLTPPIVKITAQNNQGEGSLSFTGTSIKPINWANPTIKKGMITIKYGAGQQGNGDAQWTLRFGIKYSDGTITYPSTNATIDAADEGEKSKTLQVNVPDYESGTRFEGVVIDILELPATNYWRVADIGIKMISFEGDWQ